MAIAKICVACANESEVESARSRKFLPLRRNVANVKRKKNSPYEYFYAYCPIFAAFACFREYSEIGLRRCRAAFFAVKIRAFLALGY